MMEIFGSQDHGTFQSKSTEDMQIYLTDTTRVGYTLISSIYDKTQTMRIGDQKMNVPYRDTE